MHACLGISFTAIAQPAGTQEVQGPFNPGPSAMAPVVPGQTFDVRTAFVDRSPVEATQVRVTLKGHGNWSVAGESTSASAKPNQPVSGKFTATVPADAALTRPYFVRTSIQDPRYTLTDPSQIHRPSAEPALEAIAHYEVNGVPLEIRRPVTRLDANLPFGYDTKVLAVVPAIAVTLGPVQAVTPLSLPEKKVRLKAEVLNNREGKSEGTLTLKVPEGWKVEPASHAFQFSQPGERALYQFTVSIPSLENRAYRIDAVASSAGREYREGYDTIQHRDLETRYLYREATSTVRGIDVAIARD